MVFEVSKSKSHYFSELKNSGQKSVSISGRSFQVVHSVPNTKSGNTY